MKKHSKRRFSPQVEFIQARKVYGFSLLYLQTISDFLLSIIMPSLRALAGLYKLYLERRKYGKEVLPDGQEDHYPSKGPSSSVNARS